MPNPRSLRPSVGGVDGIDGDTRARATLERIAAIGARPGDTHQQRLRAGALILTSIVIALISFVWVGIYLTYDEPVAAAIPFTYQVLTAVGLLVLARTKRFDVFRTTQLVLWLVLPPLLQLALGGFVASSAIVLWSLMAPLAAVALLGPRSARLWLLVYVVTLLTLLLVDPYARPSAAPLPTGLVVALAVLNIVGLALGAFVLLGYFVDEGERSRRALVSEQERSEALLRNTLPEPIAERLKAGEGVIADRYDEVTVLFADIAGFTERGASMSPEELVAMLDRIFSAFDALADAEGLEKIKTIGDAYMLVGGAPEPRPDHAAAVARVALGMCETVERLGWGLQIRVGIDTGPAVAGVIGDRKFAYDLWGDTVNTASRMESHGLPGSIQLTARTAAALGDGFDVRLRGTIDVKGKGPMETFLLKGARQSSS